MSITTDINQVQFIAEDFSTYQQMARDFYNKYYPATFNDVLNSDLGNALLDQTAFALMCISFTINRRASENFLSTALLNSSITKLAKMLGYPISPASPGTTDVTLTLTQAYTFPVTISNGHQFQGPGAIVYQYRGASDLIIPAGSTSIMIPASEGISKTITYISDGTQNQSFNISGIPTGQYIYNDVLAVSVDGVPWNVLSLLKYASANNAEVLFTESPPVLNFGDGITGNVPPSSAQISLTYSYGYGLNGSIGSNQLSPLTQLVVNGQVLDYTVTNTVGVVGSNPEDIRHVKAYASSFFRTQNAAVIKSDYDTIATLQNGVAVADAQIMRGVSGDLTIQMNFSSIYSGVSAIEEAAAMMFTSQVSGISYLGVSGTSGLSVGGTPNLYVGGQNYLGVSGISSLGWNGSFVTGIGSLGVSGTANLYVGGTPSLYVAGENFLGVSGTSYLGVSGIAEIQYLTALGSSSINSGVSGLSTYLSQVFSDTSKSNNVQVVILAVDGNNKYIAPSSTLIGTVQQKLQSIADAVVTVNVVDGSINIVAADIILNIGISPTADATQVTQDVITAMSQTTSPYGLMVRRPVGLSLYRSDINNALSSLLPNSGTGDVIFVDPVISYPSNPSLITVNGDLVIANQQVIQANSVTVNIVRRFKRTDIFTGNA